MASERSTVDPTVAAQAAETRMEAFRAHVRDLTRDIRHVAEQIDRHLERESDPVLIADRAAYALLNTLAVGVNGLTTKAGEVQRLRYLAGQ